MRYFYHILTIAVAVFFASAVITFADWTAPLNTPPTCLAGQAGCDPPLNTSSVSQTKNGPLIVNNLGFLTGLVVAGGNVSIGAGLSPAQKLVVANPSGNAFIDVSGPTTGLNHKGFQILEGGTVRNRFYRDQNAIFHIGTYGAEEINISSSGNVGIGLNNPASLLDVAGNIQGNYIIVDPQNLTTEGGEIRLEGAALNPDVYVDNLSGRFRVHNNVSELLSVLNSGNVGIGASTPTQKLTVNGAMLLQPIAVAPALPTNGTMYYDSAIGFRCYQSGAWVPCAGGSGTNVGQFIQAHETHIHTGGAAKSITGVEWLRCSFESEDLNGSSAPPPTYLFTGSTGGPAGAVCVAYEVTTATPNKFVIGAFCPSGQKIISGGGTAYRARSDDRPGDIMISEPTTAAGFGMSSGILRAGVLPPSATEGWRIASPNTTAYDNLVVYALCAN